MPMRDGITLEADITFPSDDGVTPAAGPFATLMNRTAYNRRVMSMMMDSVVGSVGIGPQAGAERGYAVIYQDVRGAHGSEGLLEPMLNEGPDGVDTIAWIRSQPWSDGRVGTFGPSYMGGVQILLAAEGPEGYVAAYSQVAATDQFDHDWPYIGGGVLSQALVVFWCVLEVTDNIRHLPAEVQEAIKADIIELTGEPFDPNGPPLSQSPAVAKAIATLTPMAPLRNLPVLRHVPWFREWIDNRENPAHFQANAMRDRFAGYSVATMHQGGWYDLFLRNTLSHYQGVTRQARDPQVRANQRLLIGPWSHNHSPECPGNARIDKRAIQLAWMDRWMRDKPHPVFDHNVILYIQGENRWRAEDSWPLPGTARTRYYLHSGGRANTADGDGTLSTTPPDDETPDRYSYDPANPVPTLGGISVAGSRAAQNAAEARDDVLCYTTPVLSEDVEVTGWVTATLFAATSAVDTDWWMRLVDVEPDGTAATLNHGVVRARYRNSRTSPEPVTPGEIVRYSIDMQATSNVFKAGHRIRVEVSSSCFPLGERNPNAMIDPALATVADFVVAEQTIHHDAAHASYVELPIIPQGRERRWIDTPFPLVASLATGADVTLPVAGR
jgi:uncharacterized protein